MHLILVLTGSWLSSRNRVDYALSKKEDGGIANWQAIDELNDISAEPLRFTKALTELASRLGLDIAPLDADHISLRYHQNATVDGWRAGLENSARH